MNRNADLDNPLNTNNRRRRRPPPPSTTSTSIHTDSDLIDDDEHCDQQQYMQQQRQQQPWEVKAFNINQMNESCEPLCDSRPCHDRDSTLPIHGGWEEGIGKIVKQLRESETRTAAPRIEEATAIEDFALDETASSSSYEDYRSSHEEEDEERQGDEGKAIPPVLIIKNNMQSTLSTTVIANELTAIQVDERHHQDRALACAVSPVDKKRQQYNKYRFRRTKRTPPSSASSHSYKYNYQSQSSDDDEDEETIDVDGAILELEQIDLSQSNDDLLKQSTTFHFDPIPSSPAPLEAPPEASECATASEVGAALPRCRTSRRQRSLERNLATITIPDPLYPPISSSTFQSTQPSSLRSRRTRSGSQHPSSGDGAEDSATTSSSNNSLPTTTNATNSSSSSSGLRASLDAGMAAVRRWIRSRSASPSPPPSRPLQRSSRAVHRWQRDAAAQERNHNNNSNNSVSFWSLGDEDLIALSQAGEDPRQSRSVHFDDSSYSSPLWNYRNYQFHYPPILEDDEMADSIHLRHRHSYTSQQALQATATTPSTTDGQRQRALSEPDGSLIRDFFFQRALQGGFRRRQNRSPPPLDPSRSNYAAGETVVAAAATNSNSIVAASALASPFAARATISSAPQSSTLLFQASQRSSLNVDGTNPSLSDRSSERSLSLDTIAILPDATSGVSTLDEGRQQSLQPSATSNAYIDNNTQQTIEALPQPQEQQPEGVASLEDTDPNRAARLRWIRINRRFQLIITVVALIFSLLLFGILVCWVVLTSAYVVSIDKACDVPLKPYFWLVTLQLIMDVFRTDIMRFVFRWDANSNERIPCRVIAYNIFYLTYALLVLRLGIRSVFLPMNAGGPFCRHTAPELFQSSVVFVSLSIAAWSTIVLGYLVPFCFVATLLTWNGYTPAAEGPSANGGMAGAFGGVFPNAAYPSNSGAPPNCIDQMRVVLLEEFPDDYPHECCICIGDFVAGDVIVATACNHVFHKQCCREWLRQARTCPVCRADIPSTLEASNQDDPDVSGENNHENVDDTTAAGAAASNRRVRAARNSTNSTNPVNRLGRPFAREDFHQEVVSLLRILRQHEDRMRSMQQRPRQRNISGNNNNNNSIVPRQPRGRGSNNGSSSSSGADDEDDRDNGGATGTRGNGRVMLELPTLSSASLSSSSAPSLPIAARRAPPPPPPAPAPLARSDGDLAAMEEGQTTRNNGDSSHQHSM